MLGARRNSERWNFEGIQISQDLNVVEGIVVQLWEKGRVDEEGFYLWIKENKTNGECTLNLSVIPFEVCHLTNKID